VHLDSGCDGRRPNDHGSHPSGEAAATAEGAMPAACTEQRPCIVPIPALHLAHWKHVLALCQGAGDRFHRRAGLKPTAPSSSGWCPRCERRVSWVGSAMQGGTCRARTAQCSVQPEMIYRPYSQQVRAGVSSTAHINCLPPFTWIATCRRRLPRTPTPCPCWPSPSPEPVSGARLYLQLQKLYVKLP